MAELAAEFDQLMAKAEQTDAVEDERFGLTSSATLPPELANAEARRQWLLEAQRRLQEADAARRREGIDTAKNPAQLPCTDIDSTTLPNKEGGYAPNYTPTAAVDAHGDFIVDAEVLPNANENTEVVPMVDRVEENLGQRPAAVLADTLNATGPNMVGLEQRGVGNSSHRCRRANRPREIRLCGPILDSRCPKRPGRGCRSARRPRKLDKSCFVFVPEKDVYYCPQDACWHLRRPSRTSARAEDHLAGVPVWGVRGLPVGRPLCFGEEPRRPDN